MKNMGEKPTDEDAEKKIKETDVDDAQQRPPDMSQGDSAGAGNRENCEEIVEVLQIRTQERVRIVKQIVQVVPCKNKNFSGNTKELAKVLQVK